MSAVFHIEAGSSGQLLTKVVANKDTSEEEPIVVYLHGFPDTSVDPVTGDFSSRLPRKLAESLVKEVPGVVFACFNASGCPGSDSTVAFRDKLLSREVEDTLAVISAIRARYDRPHSVVHIIGVSTGAILASLLRARAEAGPRSVVAIAGLLDLVHGIDFDFDEAQRAAFEAEGTCLKEFWVPEGYQPGPPEPSCTVAEAAAPWVKVLWPINRAYYDEAKSGRLDIASAVATGIPMLVIHGEEDAAVPLEHGLALFEAAAQPKELCRIPKANHLLTSSSHLKKAIKAILAFVRCSRRATEAMGHEEAPCGPLPGPWQRTYEATTPQELLEAYAAWAPSYDADSIGTFGYAAPQAAAEAAARLVLEADGTGGRGACRVLDAGSGTGLVGERMAGLGFGALTGVDLSPAMLAEAHARRKRCYVDLVQGDLTEPSLFPNANFAGLVCVGTLTPHHIVQGPVLRHWLRWLQPRGWAVLTLRTDFWEGQKGDLHGIRVACHALEQEKVWQLVEETLPQPYTPGVDPSITFTVRSYRLL